MRIARKIGMLLNDQLFDRRVPLSDVFLGDRHR